jgi:hypothetical protein
MIAGRKGIGSRRSDCSDATQEINKDTEAMVVKGG